jgi:prepilin-type N-terminal cleavage/methylation domain-containing protein
MVARTRNRGFSLIELVIVVVIIAIIGAIAIPRMSRGAAGAADSALVGDLKVLRSAIDLYASEHGGAFPGATTIANQLTLYSDDSGNTNATKSTTYVYGPYLRTIPALPVGATKGNTTIAASAATGVGWIYDATNGTIKSNTTSTEVDAKGNRYDTTY